MASCTPAQVVQLLEGFLRRVISDKSYYNADPSDGKCPTAFIFKFLEQLKDLQHEASSIVSMASSTASSSASSSGTSAATTVTTAPRARAKGKKKGNPTRGSGSAIVSGTAAAPNTTAAIAQESSGSKNTSAADGRERADELFLEWCMKNKIARASEPFRIDKVGTEGNGLVATAPIPKGAPLFEIPRSMMMSTVTARKSKELQPLLADPLIARTPPLCLALHLLSEKLNRGPASQWSPYINILPAKFDIPLYWQLSHFRALRDSISGSTYRLSLGLVLNTALQYCHVFNILHASTAKKQRPAFPLERFTWKNFIWATSSVLTRQNEIPAEPSVSPKTNELVLIPLWDMSNHDVGEMTSFYNFETQSLQCSALRDFQVGEQVFMFYGPRPNSQLLLYSGFVLPDNPHDSLAISLDPACLETLFTTEKQHIATQLELPVSQLVLFPHGRLSESAVAFVRILAASDAELRLLNEQPTLAHQQISPQNELQAIRIFLDFLSRVPTRNETADQVSDDRVLTQIQLFLREEHLLLHSTIAQLTSLSSAVATE